MSTPDTTVGPTIPGGLPDPGVGTITSTMSADQRLYWGVVIFWVARRLLSTDGGKYWWLLRRLLRLGLDLIELASTQGVASLTVLQKLRAGTLQGGDILSIAPANNFVGVSRDPVLSNPAGWPAARLPATGADSAQATAFKQAAATLFNFVNGAPLPGRSLVHADVPSLVTCILNTLSPALTFVAADLSRHVPLRTLTWQQPDKLEPILVSPQINFPVWSLLRDISVDWILPGVGDLPRNSVSLVTTNQKFVESFMVGVNHEMNRELLWNGYPTDQRGTYFKQFWDFRGWVQGGGQPRTEAQFADITSITDWNGTNLGTHTGRPPPPAQMVLVVRGDVIKRYPNVVVYACEAKPATSGGLTLNDDKQLYPDFQAILTGDTAFYGFQLTEAQAKTGGTGGNGYFFVLQEHPSEPHFNNRPGRQEPEARRLRCRRRRGRSGHLVRATDARGVPRQGSAAGVDLGRERESEQCPYQPASRPHDRRCRRSAPSRRTSCSRARSPTRPSLRRSATSPPTVSRSRTRKGRFSARRAS